jgi:hypothetical protein
MALTDDSRVPSGERPDDRPRPAGASRRGRRRVVGASAVTALGGLLFGYDTGVVSAALLFLKNEFGGLSSFQQELVTSLLLVGAAIATLVTVLLLAVGTAGWYVRRSRVRSVLRQSEFRPRAGGVPAAEPGQWAGWLDTSPAPVGLLSPAVLGMEWRRTKAALATRLSPTARQRVVQRRADVLDEIERRDPAGFERWLSAGAAHDVDPMEFLERGRRRGTDAA